MKSLETIIQILKEIQVDLEALNTSREAFWAQVKEDQDREDYKAQDHIDQSDPYKEFGVKRSDF
jgi:hypothetical protein